MSVSSGLQHISVIRIVVCKCHMNTTGYVSSGGELLSKKIVDNAFKYNMDEYHLNNST